MLIAAAVCPHPPLLIPAVTGRSGPGDAELDRLRTACRQAVDALAAERPDLIAVVGGAGRTAEYPPDALASLHEFGVPPGAAPPAGTPVLPLSLTIARWLLEGADTVVPPPATWWGIAADAPPEECLELGAKIAALAPRVALLAMGDGPGRRARNAPGAVDPLVDRYDEQVAAALTAPSPRALAALDPAQAGELFVAGRAAWQVLAGAAGHGDFDATAGYTAVPFEVTYFVATWRRRMKTA